MTYFKDLTDRLTSLNFSNNEDESEDTSLKNKKGKKINPLDIQVGDTIRCKNKEYVITDYMDRRHGKDQRNSMQEPNTLVYRAFDCDSETIVPLKINVDDENIESLKNDNDLYRIEFTKPKIIDGKRVIEKNELVMLAKTKKEVEERMEEKGSKIKVVRLEKLIHVKVNKE